MVGPLARKRKLHTASRLARSNLIVWLLSASTRHVLKHSSSKPASCCLSFVESAAQQPCLEIQRPSLWHSTTVCKQSRDRAYSGAFAACCMPAYTVQRFACAGPSHDATLVWHEKGAWRGCPQVPRRLKRSLSKDSACSQSCKVVAVHVGRFLFGEPMNASMVTRGSILSNILHAKAVSPSIRNCSC